MTPAFVLSPAKSLRTFLAEGGRDPRLDPAPGDEVGIRRPRMERRLIVEAVRFGRVRGRTVERDLGTRGWCEREGCFELSLDGWRAGQAGFDVQVFVVAGDAAEAR